MSLTSIDFFLRACRITCCQQVISVIPGQINWNAKTLVSERSRLSECCIYFYLQKHPCSVTNHLKHLRVRHSLLTNMYAHGVNRLALFPRGQETTVEPQSTIPPHVASLPVSEVLVLYQVLSQRYSRVLRRYLSCWIFE